MKYIDRNGKEIHQDSGQDKLLKCLYTTLPGRILLKPLVTPAVSRIAGAFLDTRASRCLIAPFIRQMKVDLRPYEKEEYPSFNAFFTRHIRPEERMIDMDPHSLVSPGDGKVSVYPIERDSTFTIKHTRYTVASLLRSKKLAARYEGGEAVIIRLTVDDYHRYCYPADGICSPSRRIAGVLHTVNPIAGEVYPIYKENTREYTVISTKAFGRVLQMEVGALLVGRICNRENGGRAEKGREKGCFAYGGSTILLLLEKGKAKADPRLLLNTARGYETMIHMGEMIARSCQ